MFLLLGGNNEEVHKTSRLTRSVVMARKEEDCSVSCCTHDVWGSYLLGFHEDRVQYLR